MIFCFFCCSFSGQQRQKDFEIHVEPSIQQVNRILRTPMESRGRPEYFVTIEQVNKLSLPDSMKSELIRLVRAEKLQSDAGLLAIQRAILILYENKSTQQIFVLQWLLSCLESQKVTTIVL